MRLHQHLLRKGSDDVTESSATSRNHDFVADDGDLNQADVVIIADDNVVPIESNNVIRKRCSSSDLSVYDRFPIYHCSSGMETCVVNDDSEGNCETIDEEEYAVDDDALADTSDVQTGEANIVSMLPGIHDIMPNDVHSQELEGYSRPYFLYSQVIKKSAKSRVGVSFQNKRIEIAGGRATTSVIISRISDDGLFGRSNDFCLQSGDEVISVNNLSASNLKASQVAKILRQAPSTISLTVRNTSGDPRIVFSSIQKPSSEAMVGVALSNKCFGNTLVITRVESDGLFGHSLLMPGQRCLMINGISCRNLPSPEAVKLIHRNVTKDGGDENPNRPHHVTIISKPPLKSHDYAMVLSSDNTRVGWYQSFMKLFGYRIALVASGGVNRNGEIVAVATEVDNETVASTARSRRNRFRLRGHRHNRIRE